MKPSPTPKRGKWKPCGCLTDGRNWIETCDYHGKLHRDLRKAIKARDAYHAKFLDAHNALIAQSRAPAFKPEAEGSRSSEGITYGCTSVAARVEPLCVGDVRFINKTPAPDAGKS